MTSALAVREVTATTWQTIMAIAPTVAKARLFKVATTEQAAVILLKGHELGLGLTNAFEFIDIISDRPTLSPRGALALIHMSGQLEAMSVDGNDTACTVSMRRRGGFEFTTTYSIEDAKRAGLVKPDSNWIKYPANMLRWRAIGYVADVVFPDVMGGMKRADEFGADVTEDGDVTRPEVITVEATTLASVSLDQLVSEFGPEAVMEAAGGIIPGTVDELVAVADKLRTAEPVTA